MFSIAVILMIWQIIMSGSFSNSDHSVGNRVILRVRDPIFVHETTAKFE